MGTKTVFLRRAAGLTGPVFVITLFSNTVAAQNPAESLSASFRKAADRIAPSLVGVRAMGVSPRPLVTVPIPNVGPFRPTDFIPRGVLGNSNEVESETIGSGLVLDADRGIVVTTDGVLRGASQAMIVFADGSERPTAQIRRDPRSDVAILVVDLKGQNTSAAPWGDSNTLQPGDWVLALGAAAGLPPSMSAGIYSARRRGSGSSLEWLETDARLGPAFLGGPVVNMKGEVIGVAGTSPNAAPSFVSQFILPAGRVRRIAGDLADFGQVRRGYLGVQVEPAQVVSGALGAPAGVVVSSVGAGTPADQAGIRPGDRIISANGRRLVMLAQLQAMVEETPIGDEVILLVDRNGQRLELKVRPQAQPGPRESATMPRTRGEGNTRVIPGRVRSRVVPARPAPQPSSPSDSSDPSALEPIPGADQNSAPPPAPRPEGGLQ